jgi:hypothetical protein
MSATAPTIDVEELYRATAREASIVEVPAMHFLMVDGTGNPNEPGAFQDAIRALPGAAGGCDS